MNRAEHAQPPSGDVGPEAKPEAAPPAGFCPVTYAKRAPGKLADSVAKIGVADLQSYLPIYGRFFATNESNWNTFAFQHVDHVVSVDNPVYMEASSNAMLTGQTYSHASKTTTTQSLFMKSVPLLDPYNYLTGLYASHDLAALCRLPRPGHCDGAAAHPDVSDAANSASVDGMFSFLSGQLARERGFVHGVGFYGSFLGVARDFTFNVADDIQQLANSAYFLAHRQSDKFTVDDFEHLLDEPLGGRRGAPLVISAEEVELVADDIVGGLVAGEPPVSGSIGGSDLGTCGDGSELGTCGDGSDSEFTGAPDSSDGEISDDDFSDDETTSASGRSRGSDDDSDSGSSGSGGSSGSSSGELEPEVLSATIPTFPVQLIFMERCEGTLDDLAVQDSMTEEQWMAALMQIVMTLLVYQHAFSFTHNDLHSNNIMYCSTPVQFLYYSYQGATYKVPTFGRIFKIIDFGRAIFKHEGRLFCGTDYRVGGVAEGQYNCEPFFNPRKARNDPNPGGDLCRLACSLIDLVVDNPVDLRPRTMAKQPAHTRILADWCIDDRGKSVVYTARGDERYPGFDLYIAISKHARRHTPREQLRRPEFARYRLRKAPRHAKVFCVEAVAMRALGGKKSAAPAAAGAAPPSAHDA